MPSTFKLREFPAAPGGGTVGKATWTQHMAGIRFSLPLRGDGWADVKADDILVELSEWELKVRCNKKRSDENGLLKSLNGELQEDACLEFSWWCIEKQKVPPETQRQAEGDAARNSARRWDAAAL